MKPLKWALLCGTVIFLLNFPLHFLYDFFPNLLTSIISPVNESVAEHMKMMFSSYILGSFLIIPFVKRKQDYILFANTLAGLVGIGLFLLMYVPFVIAIHEIMIVTFFFLFLAIFASQIVCYYIVFFTKIKYRTAYFVGILLLFYIISTYFMYYPPHMEFFLDPTNHTYGLLQ
jgi:hypothetical protein